MARVIDFSYDRPTPARLKSLGTATNPVVGVMRYVSPQSSKNLSLAEYAALKAAGFAVGLVWEGNANGALGGQGQGTVDAQRANTQADALGFPRTSPIYFAIDFEVLSPSVMSTVLNYIRAVKAVSIRKVGVYGSFSVIEAAASAGVADYFWQTSAWSYGKTSSHRNLYQHIYNVDTDVNEALTADWGQDKPPAAPKPKPTFPPFPLSAGNAFGSPSFLSGHGFELWQRQMKARGWSINTDGVYTATTNTVVLQFQAEKGLVVDGLVGELTWDAAWKAPVT